MFLHKNVRRNRLECRFGAEYRGKNPVFFTDYFYRIFFGRYLIFSSNSLDFSRGKNPMNSRENFGAITDSFLQHLRDSDGLRRRVHTKLPLARAQVPLRRTWLDGSCHCWPVQRIPRACSPAASRTLSRPLSREGPLQRQGRQTDCRAHL